MTAVTDRYWNSNVAHHPMILAAVPPGCRPALDVGCGDGLLAVRLAERAKRVVGVDLSEEMIAQARRGSPAAVRTSNCSRATSSRRSNRATSPGRSTSSAR